MLTYGSNLITGDDCYRLRVNSLVSIEAMQQHVADLMDMRLEYERCVVGSNGGVGMVLQIVLGRLNTCIRGGVDNNNDNNDDYIYRMQDHLDIDDSTEQTALQLVIDDLFLAKRDLFKGEKKEDVICICTREEKGS